MSSAAQRVQLAYAHGVLEGSAGTEQVTVQITPGVVTGELGGVIVEATWHKMCIRDRPTSMGDLRGCPAAFEWLGSTDPRA